MFSICPSVCACVYVRACVRAEAFSGRLAVDLYTVRQKKGTNFVLCASFSTWQDADLPPTRCDFFTYIRPKESTSISYNSVCLILACVKYVAATVTLNILCLPVKQWNRWLPASVYSFNVITTRNSYAYQKLNTRNCSLCVPEYIRKKITSFCQVLKEMHTKENRFLFLPHGAVWFPCCSFS